MEEPIRLMLVTADPLVRSGLSTLLEHDGSCGIGYVTSPAILRSSVAQDMALPETDVAQWDLGCESGDLDTLDFQELDLPVVALVSDESQAVQAWNEGARAILSRQLEGAQLLSAVRAMRVGLLFLILATVAMTAACGPATDLSQAGTPLAMVAGTPTQTALKQVSPQHPSRTAAITDPASSYPYPLETTKELIGQWVTYGWAGGPENSDIKPARIELEIRPDNTYSYYTPALHGYGLVEIDVPAKQHYGKWRIESRENWEEVWGAGSGHWNGCCICADRNDVDYVLE